MAAKEEASHALGFGKTLGVSCGADESEILQKLIEIEVLDVGGRKYRNAQTRSLLPLWDYMNSQHGDGVV
ncbi:hypothetical protein MRB53_020931 [Persea americana]|uniref:Uncharacterized protein n=1 Tax=Persea americana TaxID=3435 RepID=A0ACC2L2B1_PERAE|nr:hypothetical protein MRB53_020931 [Persea americana]